MCTLGVGRPPFLRTEVLQSLNIGQPQLKRNIEWTLTRTASAIVRKKKLHHYLDQG